MPITPSGLQHLRNEQSAYDAKVRAIIAAHDVLIASTTDLILESRALLARTDRQAATKEPLVPTWPPSRT